jgi:hypothetical protein
MDDMTDLMAGDVMLWRRLDAFAEARLSPDLTTSSRLRARVLAVAHRRADLARADAGLTVLSRPEGTTGTPPLAARAAELLSAAGHRRRRRLQRAVGVVLAATLAAVLAVGGVLAARPAGFLYDARVWAETLTLPSDPSERAVADLDRLEQRLREAAEASQSGDAAGVTAALEAYQSIMDQASAAAIMAGDEVATAVIETGVGRNLEVLRGLVERVPDRASTAISRALDAAIARSAAAVDRIGASRPGPNGNGAVPGQPAADPTPHATKSPTARPTPEPTPRARPTHAATPKPTKTPGDVTPPPDDGEGGYQPTNSPEPHGGPPNGDAPSN